MDKSRQAEGDRAVLSARVSRKVRSQFKAVAELSGQTMEERIEHLMREDIARFGLPAAATRAPAAATT